MTLGIPSLFPSRSELISSFDYVDLITGNAYITMKGGVTPSALATYESYTTGDDADSAIFNNSGDWIAQTFTIGTIGSNSAFHPTKIRVKSGNALTSTVTLEIQETTAGEPNGTVKVKILNSAKVIESGANDWYEFDLTDSTQNDGEALQPNTMYAIVLRGSTGRTARKDDNDATYTGGAHWTTPDSGLNWTEQTGDDLMFEIKGNLINPYVLSIANFISSFLSTTVHQQAISTDIDTECGRVIFETTFNQSVIIDGIAFVSYQYTSAVNASVSEVELWHVRGATETKIGEAEAFLDDKTPSIQMDLTRTALKPGDKIKLKIILNYLDTGTNNAMTLLHDPNTAGNEVILNLPFRTEL